MGEIMKNAAIFVLAIAGCLDTKYEGDTVSDLMPLEQQSFCADAAEQYTKLLIGQVAATCSMNALFSDDCETTYDDCLTEYPQADEVTSSSAGVVYGTQACIDLFNDGDFSDCDVAAEVYIECVQEQQEDLNGLEADQVCSTSNESDEVSDACEEVLADCPDNPMSMETITEAVDDNSDD